MMSHDLEPEALAQFGANGAGSFKLVNKLLGGSSGGAGGKETRLSVTSDEVSLDERFDDLRDLCHILDADTSQTKVIDAAVEGKNLVVEGPPGTGKSQTIANIIGAAVASGKRVLFAAEKKAALDVVFKRLQQCGLDGLCLELHSHKSSRKLVYDDLRRSLETEFDRSLSGELYERLRETRDELNRTSDLIHKVDPVTDNTPFLLMGRMGELTAKGIAPPDYIIDGIGSWPKETFEQKLNLLAGWVELVKKKWA